VGNLDRRLAAHERQLKALELRLAGVTYQQIADELGYAGRQGAFKAVEAALRLTLREPADNLRRISAERLDRATLAIWRAVNAGDLQAIDRLLRIEARRAKLLGLDAPQRQEVAGADDGPLQIIVEHVGREEWQGT
jgi:hypothetical protein